MPEHFIGEIELIDDEPKAGDFSGFEDLPNRKLISSLAEKHKDFFELMPYQKQGEPVQLVASAYLRKPNTEGRIIAVLLRADYPKDIETLRELVKSALGRLQSAETLKQHFDSVSIQTAEQELERMIKDIQ